MTMFADDWWRNGGSPLFYKMVLARFAVLVPPNKELRIVWAGCFTPGMLLFDDSKCKRISSYSQHWDTRKGNRKESCKAVGYDSLENCIQRVNAIKDEDVKGADPIDAIYDSICNDIDMLSMVITTGLAESDV
jgi:hypothetical protein